MSQPLLCRMKSTKVQTSPISINRALRHLPQSTEPRAVLGSKCIMATPAEGPDTRGQGVRDFEIKLISKRFPDFNEIS